MHVTGHVADAEIYHLQVERLVSSHTLHGSESLCRLLRYLGEHSLKHPGVPLKEYQIATEVFGRSPDFDPHLDSLIRVQAGRLRSKLAEYYASEGADDSVVVELPKGSYAVSFHHSTAVPKAIAHGAAANEIITLSSNGALPIIALSVLLAVAVVVIAGLLLNRSRASATYQEDAAPRTSEDAPGAFRVFWQAFTSGPDEPWVIFSNGAFVGRPETGLRYFNPATDSGKAVFDHYTGVGEVLAVYDLAHSFALLHREIRVKRGSLFSLDDAKNNNLIFVGSPAENLTLREIPSTHEFIFQRLKSGKRKNDLAVVNVHPQPDEPKSFLASPAGTPLTEDYAIIGLVPGMNPARWVLILAGTTTIGTQAAAEYVCRKDSLERLLLRLSVSDNGQMRPFEAVLRVKVTQGVPVNTELVALRRIAQ
ncbi:MAG: helix-turn-helix domain-containing protein [Terriglobales bacterium]